MLLTLFPIITGALLTGLFTFVPGQNHLQPRPHEATHEKLHTLAYISLALGALAGGGVGALWSRLMNRIPPAAGADRIIPRGIGLGAVAGMIAALLAYLGPMLIYLQFDECKRLLIFVPLQGIPTGMAAGLVCSLFAWGLAAWERKRTSAPRQARIDDANAPGRVRLPRILLTIFVLLSTAFGSAVFYGYLGGDVARLIGVLAGAVAGGIAAALWLFVMAQLPPDTGYGRTILTGGALAAAEGVFAALMVFLSIVIATHNNEPLADDLVFLLPFLLGFGVLPGLFAGSVFGMLVWFLMFWERNKLAKEKGRRFFAQRGQTTPNIQPNP
jgi:hypothetical protein